MVLRNGLEHFELLLAGGKAADCFHETTLIDWSLDSADGPMGRPLFGDFTLG